MANSTELVELSKFLTLEKIKDIDDVGVDKEAGVDEVRVNEEVEVDEEVEVTEELEVAVTPIVGRGVGEPLKLIVPRPEAQSQSFGLPSIQQ